MRVSDLKVFLFDKMNRLNKKLSNNDKMRIAMNLHISIENVKKYTNGKIQDFRSLETMEKIIDEAEKIISYKSTSVGEEIMN
jgi:hypothetical protein